MIVSIRKEELNGEHGRMDQFYLRRNDVARVCGFGCERGQAFSFPGSAWERTAWEAPPPDR